MTKLLPAPVAALLLSVPLTATAQDSQALGVNLGIVGVEHLGITYHLAPFVTLRAGVLFDWSKGDPRPGTTRTQLGLDIDLLFPVAANDVLIPYLGIGGDISQLWLRSSYVDEDSVVWGGNGIFGVRLPVVERLSVYGELAVRYSSDERAAPSGEIIRVQHITVGTAAIGAVVYLN